MFKEPNDRKAPLKVTLEATNTPSPKKNVQMKGCIIWMIPFQFRALDIEMQNKNECKSATKQMKEMYLKNSPYTNLEEIFWSKAPN